MNRVLARLFLLALVGILVFPALSDAQMTRGAISGTVRDATGALVPGATVTATNTDTNISRSTVTDTQGFYRIPALEAGRYAVKAELSGFQTVEYKDIRLVSASEYRARSMGLSMRTIRVRSTGVATITRSHGTRRMVSSRSRTWASP